MESRRRSGLAVFQTKKPAGGPSAGLPASDRPITVTDIKAAWYQSRRRHEGEPEDIWFDNIFHTLVLHQSHRRGTWLRLVVVAPGYAPPPSLNRTPEQRDR